MYDTKCPFCKQAFTDTENKLSILTTGLCLLCRQEGLTNDESRWEDEGGYANP